MTHKQSIKYVELLNFLYVNKVITREEMRDAISLVPIFSKVCKKSKERD
jgi:hypothetical protein